MATGTAWSSASALMVLAVAASIVVAGCATGGGGSPGGNPGNMQFSAPAELVGTASLPADATHPSVVVATALVLEAVGWPVASADTVRGALVSEWQYFEPAVRTSSLQGSCANPVAIRFIVRPFNNRAQLSAEASLPPPIRSYRGWSDDPAVGADPERQRAFLEARATLASLHRAVAATGGAQEAEIRAMTDFGRQLDNGGYRRCSDQAR